MKDLSPKTESLGAGGAASVSLLPSPKAILARIVRKWYWCVLSLCVCLPLAYLYAARQPQVYGKATTILIKDDYPKESVAATVLASTNGIVNTAATNLDNEIFLLSSHSLLETVVRKLKLDVTYWKKDKFRKVEIYQDSPIAVQFTQEGEAADARFRVVPLSETEFRLEKDEKDRQGQETGTFGKEVRFDSLTFIVEKTPRFSEAALNVPVIVRKTSVRNAAVGLRSGLTVKKANGKNNLVNISMRCNNPVKAENILHSIVHFYNEASLKEKNTRGRKTNKFIGERLAVISEEMRKNDLAVEKLKKETDILTDLSTALTEEYENSINDKKDLRELELEIKSIEYLKQYLEEEAEHDARLVPLNSKIADMGIRDQIGVFNDTLLKKTSLKVNAGDNNPIVRELEANLSSLKDALKRSVNNYYTSLLVKKKNIQDQHEKTREHIRNVSSRERDVNYIDREQRVRESLYVLLLNKREENSLALAATEDNARMVDDVRGGNGPLEPNVPKILMVGFLAGLAIPVVLCVVAAMLDSNVKRRKEIEALTAIPVYGEAAEAEEPGNRGEFGGAFRVVRMFPPAGGTHGGPFRRECGKTPQRPDYVHLFRGREDLSLREPGPFPGRGRKKGAPDGYGFKERIAQFPAGRSRETGHRRSGTGRGRRLAFPGGTVPSFRPSGLFVCWNPAGPSFPAVAA